MKVNLTGLAILACLPVVGAVIFSDGRSDILPAMAGCFEAPASLAMAQIRVGASGDFVTQAGTTRVSARGDEMGAFLEPAAGVVIRDGTLSLDPGHPLLMRITPDRRSFAVPNMNGNDIYFARAKCV